MAKNIDVIETFLNGGLKGRASNLKIEGDKLINYGTVIAEREVDSNGVYSFKVNVTNYSSSTTAIQNKVRRELDVKGERYSIWDLVPMGAGSL